MVIESWMISMFIAVAGVIASWATTKTKVASNASEIDAVRDDIKDNFATMKETHLTMFSRLDAHGDDIVALKTRSELAMTAKDVDDKYVSKELFRQFEKHIDKRFDALEAGQAEILDFIRNQKRGCND